VGKYKIHLYSFRNR